MNPKTTALEKSVAKPQSAASEIVDTGFAMVRTGQETALHAARGFVELVDVVLPVQGGDESHRRQVIDGAFQLADQVAAAQLSVMRGAVHRPHLRLIDFGLNAFNFEGVDVDVTVTVPTDVGAFNSKHV